MAQPFYLQFVTQFDTALDLEFVRAEAMNALPFSSVNRLPATLIYLHRERHDTQ